MTRGKVVIIQNFAGAIHGLLYSSFTAIQHKSYSTNWDQHDRWISIKNFIVATSAAKSSRISFWTGSVGSFPYFCASGKSSPQNGAPRLATGLTTPGFRSYYPDFPRVACFIGICTIAFEGINILGMNYINGNGISYMGIVFIDFPGDTLISSAIAKNANLFGKCNVTQLSQGCTACSTAGICVSCNDLLHYLLDTTTSTCIAASGYYLNASFIP
jgi:1-phosphatidylinositol phosphodiesterase